MVDRLLQEVTLTSCCVLVSIEGAHKLVVVLAILGGCTRTALLVVLVA